MAAQGPAMPCQPTGIMQLPPELRAMIYHYALIVPETFAWLDLHQLISSTSNGPLPSILHVDANTKASLLHDFLKVNEVYVHAIYMAEQAIRDFESARGLRDSEGGFLCIRYARVAFELDLALIDRCQNVRSIELSVRLSAEILRDVARDGAQQDDQYIGRILRSTPQLKRLIFCVSHGVDIGRLDGLQESIKKIERLIDEMRRNAEVEIKMIV